MALYLNWNLVLLVPGSSGIVYTHPSVAAWVGDPSANTASVANTCVNGPLLPSSIPSFFLLPTPPTEQTARPGVVPSATLHVPSFSQWHWANTEAEQNEKKDLRKEWDHTPCDNTVTAARDLRDKVALHCVHVHV